MFFSALRFSALCLIAFYMESVYPANIVYTNSHLKFLLWIVKASFPSYQLKEYFIVTFILSKKWLLIVLCVIPPPHSHPQCVLLHRNSYQCRGFIQCWWSPCGFILCRWSPCGFILCWWSPLFYTCMNTHLYHISDL